MALTAADVRAMKFRTTRLRAGYNMDAVDAFLDVIEADVAQSTDELQRLRDGEAVLRTQCDQLQTRLQIAEARLVEAEAAVASSRIAAVTGPEPVVPDALVDVLPDNPDAADVLAVAQRTADEIVRFARAREAAIRAAVRATLDEQRAILDRD